MAHGRTWPANLSETCVTHKCMTCVTHKCMAHASTWPTNLSGTQSQRTYKYLAQVLQVCKYIPKWSGKKWKEKYPPCLKSAQFWEGGGAPWILIQDKAAFFDLGDSFDKLFLQWHLLRCLSDNLKKWQWQLWLQNSSVLYNYYNVMH